MSQRCLNREQAAEYCGLAPTGFDDWVKRGLVPRCIPGTKRWDRKALDAALDKRSGIVPESQPEPSPDEALQGWLAGNAD